MNDTGVTENNEGKFDENQTSLQDVNSGEESNNLDNDNDVTQSSDSARESGSAEKDDKLIDWDKVPVVKDIRQISSNLKSKKKQRKNLFLVLGSHLVLFILVALIMIPEKILDPIADFSGSTTIVVQEKNSDNGCNSVISDDTFYCVDAESFRKAQIGRKYKVDQMEHDYKLREVFE